MLVGSAARAAAGAGFGGAPGAGLTGAAATGGAAALHLHVQREFVDAVTGRMRPPACAGTGTSLISTSSGFSSYGDASRLRISVETRAFDCA